LLLKPRAVCGASRLRRGGFSRSGPDPGGIAKP
jgi:hypothetical protein